MHLFQSKMVKFFLKNAYIKPYEKTSSYAPNTLRTRKLLLNKLEINKITRQQQLKGNSIIPLKVYIKNGLVKVEIATVKVKNCMISEKFSKKRQLTERL